MGDHPPRRIGIALSGGGLRAAVFHCGVLHRLAQSEMLEQVTHLSSVSGGSLAVGLVYGLSNQHWPSSAAYLAEVVPQVRSVLTNVDLEHATIAQGIRRPWLIRTNRSRLVALALEWRWHIRGSLNDVPPEPRWTINATTYESGKAWRFTPERMGDYVVGHVAQPDIPLADTLAASAGYPGLIGPLVIKTDRYTWFQYVNGSQSVTEQPYTPLRSKLHLWDGGVYDNLGVEPLFKPSRGGTEERYRDGVDFLIISDASSPFDEEERAGVFHRAKRLLAIATGQVRSLRARSIFAHLKQQPGTGVYLKMGNTGNYILAQARKAEISPLLAFGTTLSDQQVQSAARLPTRLSRLSAAQFDCAYRHGWEVAHHTLSVYSSDLFPAPDLTAAPTA